MNEAWAQVLLEDFAEEITVGHVGPMATEYVPAGITFLRSQNVEPFRVTLNEVKYISPDFHSRLRKSVLRPGDVVIVRTGKPGACAVIPKWMKEANCSDLVIVRSGPKLDAYFLCYYVNSVASHHVASHLVGAVQQHFNVGSARKMKLFLPPLPEQQAIAHILGTLDDKVELNRRMNKTLESIARAIFKSWFIDFEPIPGLGPHKEWEDSVLGKIPKGWKLLPIGDATRVVGGSTPSTAEPTYWAPETHWWATPKDLSNLQSPVLRETARKISDEGLGKISSGLLPKGTVLLSSRAPVGYLAIASVPVAINQGFIAMICDEKPLSNYYVYHWTQTVMDEIKNRACGTTFQEISKTNFRPMLVLTPTRRAVSVFDTHCKSLFDKLVSNLKESNTLESIRDTLLPKLLSGEIRIKDAEKIVSQAV